MFVKRHRNMIFASIFGFYLGCCITLNFMKLECSSEKLNYNNDENAPITYDGVEYAVLILSSPTNEERRDAIRATWANFINNIVTENGVTIYKWNHTRSGQSFKQENIKCFFALGIKNIGAKHLKKLSSEASHSSDMLLLEDLEDHYVNLTLKLILSLNWLNNNLKNLKYLVKCDDDSFVRVDLIVKDLEAFAPHMNAPYISEFVSYKNMLPSYKGLYWGYFNGKAKVYYNGKWMEKQWFLCDTYLPYALGGGYVISQSIVQYVAKNSEFLSRYNSEDVSMGVWTAALDGINRVHDVRFDTEWTSRGCEPHMIVRHKQSPSDMFQMYKTLVHTKGTNLCKTENIIRSSYKYNWNTNPSACCKINNEL